MFCFSYFDALEADIHWLRLGPSERPGVGLLLCFSLNDPFTFPPFSPPFFLLLTPKKGVQTKPIRIPLESHPGVEPACFIGLLYLLFFVFFFSSVGDKLRPFFLKALTSTVAMGNEKLSYKRFGDGVFIFK